MKNRFSDAELTAYLDGELDSAARADVEQALSSDPELREQLASLTVPIDTMKDSFNAVLHTAPRIAPLPTNAPARGILPPLALAAALALCAVLGVWSFSSDRSRQTTDWRVAVAEYQVLYVTETLSSADPGPDGGIELLGRMSQVLGHDLLDARNSDDLDFRRAQILGFNGQPLIQVAYLADETVPVALCITRVGESDQAVETEFLQGLAASHWVSGGFGYILIGGTDLERIDRIARDFRARL